MTDKSSTSCSSLTDVAFEELSNDNREMISSLVDAENGRAENRGASFGASVDVAERSRLRVASATPGGVTGLGEK